MKNEILQQFVNIAKEIYDNDLCRIVLYGSFARGENTPESDIDIALIVKNNTNAKEDALLDAVVSCNLQFDVVISTITIEEEKFNYWADYMPFYKNINKDGVLLWTAA